MEKYFDQEGSPVVKINDANQEVNESGNKPEHEQRQAIINHSTTDSTEDNPKDPDVVMTEVI